MAEQTAPIENRALRFIEKRFSLVLGAFLSILAGLAVLPAGLTPDAEEVPARLHGHLGTITMNRGATDEKNTYDFTIEELPKVFHVEGLSIADQNLLLNLEKKGNEFHFAVDRNLLKRSSKPIPVFELSSHENVYIAPSVSAGERAKGRYFLLLVGISFVVGGLMVWRKLKAQYANYEPDGDIDPHLISAAKQVPLFLASMAFSIFCITAILPFSNGWYCLGLSVVIYALSLIYYALVGRHSLWIKSLLERESQAAEARRNGRVATTAPKYMKAVQLLLKSKANLDSQNKEGRTPLHISAEGAHVEAVELLLKNGASPNVVDADGNTPLMIAAERGYLGVAMKLLDVSARVDLVNNGGLNALALAQKNKKKKNPAMVDLLTKAAEKQKLKKLQEEEAAKKKQAEGALESAAPGNTVKLGDKKN